MWAIAIGIVLGILTLRLLDSLGDLAWELFKTKEFWIILGILGVILLIWLDGGWDKFSNDLGGFIISTWWLYLLIGIGYLFYRAKRQVERTKELGRLENINSLKTSSRPKVKPIEDDWAISKLANASDWHSAMQVQGIIVPGILVSYLNKYMQKNNCSFEVAYNKFKELRVFYIKAVGHAPVVIVSEEALSKIIETYKL